eukprot:gene9198-14264_t
MTLYILRHEARGSDQTFNSRLTPDGKAAAEGKLAATLQQLGIQTVFCSPFVRTIETIAPYCTRNGHEIRLEWGLCEFLASRQHAALENPAPHPPEVFGCKIAESSSVVPPESLRYPERACSEGSRIASIFREHADIFDCPLPDILSGVDDPLFGFVYSRAVPAECLPCEALDDEQIQQLLPFYKALPAKRPPSVRWENPPVTSTVDPPGLDSFAVPTGHKWSRLLWVLRWCVAEENAFEDRFQAFIPHLFHFVLRGGALAHGVKSLLAAVALAILAGIESAMRTFPSLRGDPKTATKLWRKALLKSGVMGAVLSLLCSVRWLQHEEGGACAPANNASRSAVRVALLARWGARIVAHFRSAGGATVFFPKQALFAVQVIEGCAAAAARAAQEAKHSDAWRKVLAQESAGLTRFYADLVSSARADEFATERNCADIDDDEWETGNLSVADDPHDTTLNTARNMRQKRYLDFLAGKVDLRWCSFAEAREKLSFFPFISLNYSSVDDYLLGSDCAEQCLRLTLLDALRILSRMSEGVSAAYGKMSPTPPLHAAVFELEQAKTRTWQHEEKDQVQRSKAPVLLPGRLI